MNRADRTVQILGLAATSSMRARFVEEWQADLAAARSVGLSPAQILAAAAAARVAVFLLWVRVRAQVRRRRRRAELLRSGALLGFVLVVTAAPLDDLVPFVVLAIGWRCWELLRAWIDGGR
jgi:hypothetical protein